MTDQVGQVSEAVAEKVTEHVTFVQWFWHNVLWKPGTGEMLWGMLLRVVFAALLWWIGTRLIRKILGLSLRPKMQLPMDRTMRRFLLNVTRTALYALLVLAVIVVLGIPMASVTAVVASTGVTLGLAMQGALSNLAGGIMLIVATAIVWFMLDQMHVFATIEGLVKTVAGERSNTFSAIVAYLELPRALAVSTIIAVVDMVLVTALSTLGAFLYNITATLVGGIHLTLADE